MICNPKEITLLIQVDALRYDYINQIDTPYLFDLSESGYSGRLIPTFGFEPDGAYLAGLFPDQCDGGAHFWKDPDKSPYSFTKYLPKRLEKIEGMSGKVIRKILTKYIRLKKGYKYEFMPVAPFNVLENMAPVPSFFPPEEKTHNCEDIFSICQRENIGFLFHGSPQNRVDVKSGAAALEKNLYYPYRFAFWHVGDLDKMGHRFGPNSIERKIATIKVDETIETVVRFLKKRYEKVNLLIFGDHGMAEVRKYIDIPAHLKNSGIFKTDPPLFFLDSTMARFWFTKKQQKEEICNALGELEGGKILTQDDLTKYHLLYNHNKFADLIFLAESGSLLSPNYFQGHERIKGMHGYSPETLEQQSAFILSSPRLKNHISDSVPQDMRKIFGTILTLLNIQNGNSAVYSLLVS